MVLTRSGGRLVVARPPVGFSFAQGTGSGTPTAGRPFPPATDPDTFFRAGDRTEEYAAMADDRIPMTRDGYDKLKGELERLRTVEMIAVTKRVAAARDLGDLSENAEYHAAREDQGLLQAKINELSDRVTVMDLDVDVEETFELVGPGQENPEKGRILTSSPIGQGLLGKKKGEVAEIQVPSGTIRFKVLDISVASID